MAQVQKNINSRKSHLLSQCAYIVDGVNVNYILFSEKSQLKVKATLLKVKLFYIDCPRWITEYAFQEKPVTEKVNRFMDEI
jgi:hypothetical protein